MDQKNRQYRIYIHDVLSLRQDFLTPFHMIRKLLVVIFVFSGLSAPCLAENYGNDSASFFRVYDSIWEYYDQQQFDKAIGVAEKLIQQLKGGEEVIT